MGNFLLPLLIGARDVAFPRINLMSWWFYISGAMVILVSLFTGGGAPDTGWTFYVPYSIRTGTNVTLAVFGVFLLGISSTMTGLNFVTTIHRLRAPGMKWFRMPLFVWSIYATGWVQILATPVFGLTLLLLIAERLFGFGLFDPAKGGDPLLFEHLFWIYSHPAVYIMILPAMGAVTEIIPVFARRTIFGYKAIAFSSLAIASAGYLVWGHHMFTSGMSDTAKMVFSFLTFIVAIPSGIKVFNWVASLYKGSIELRLSASVHHIFYISFFYRRSYRTHQRGARNKYLCSRHIFYRGPFPLYDVRRNGVCLFCRTSLLVSKDHRQDVQGIVSNKGLYYPVYWF